MKRREVIRLRAGPGGHDADGDPVASTVERTTIPRCLVAPRTESASEDRGRHGVVVGLDLYTDGTVDLIHTDRIEIDGVAYDIDGEPGHWPGSRVGGTYAALTRSKG